MVALAAVCALRAGDGPPRPVLAQAESVASLGNPSAAIPAMRQEWEIYPVQRLIVPAGRQLINVPILMYHYIQFADPRDKLGWNLSVNPWDFQAQLDWLAGNGYHPIDFNDLRGYLQGWWDLPANPVVLTFDDGYRDFYTTAWPILREHRFKAVSYVVTGFLGGPNYLSAEMVRELDRGGVQIGSHTVGHVDLTKAGGGLWYQLAESRSYLEGLLGHPVVDFCYPSGKVSAYVANAVAAAGYQTATTTVYGTRHGWGDRYLWTRVRVSGGQSLADFTRQLGPSEPTLSMTFNPVADLPAGPPTTLPRIFPLLAPRVVALQPRS